MALKDKRPFLNAFSFQESKILSWTPNWCFRAWKGGPLEWRGDKIYQCTAQEKDLWGSLKPKWGNERTISQYVWSRASLGLVSSLCVHQPVCTWVGLPWDEWEYSIFAWNIRCRPKCWADGQGRGQDFPLKIKKERGFISLGQELLKEIQYLSLWCQWKMKKLLALVIEVYV